MKTKITQDNYQEIVLKRSIIICWVLLAICLVIKLFGGNFFEMVCTNEKFINVCNFIDKSFVRYIVYYLSFITSSLLLLKIVSPELKMFEKKTLVFLLICTLTWAAKLFIELSNVTISLVLLDIVDFVVLFFSLWLISKKPFMAIISIVLLFVFTLVSAIVKNVGMSQVLTDSYILTNIFVIDYYIMLMLTYLYLKKKYNRRKL